METGDAPRPLDWDMWRKQGFNILTPEAYHLYRKYTNEILDEQRDDLQGEIKEKTTNWLNTLEDYLKGGFQPNEWNLYPTKIQVGGSRLNEILKKRKFWLMMRRKWDDHWNRLAQKLLGQKGGSVDVLGEQWNQYQSDEATLDCRYRWNDKIRHYVNDFLENESRDFRHYLMNPRDPVNQLMEYKWERPWIERRMGLLRDRLSQMAGDRETLRDPKWIPLDERLKGPIGWEQFWDKIRSWDGSQWVREHISPDEMNLWLQQNDLRFLRRSLQMWKSWGPGQEVPWTCRAWWDWFINQEGFRGWNVLLGEFQDAWERGLPVSDSQMVEKLIESSKNIDSLHEPYAQQEWLFKSIPLMISIRERVPVQGATSRMVEDAARRDSALQWIGWKKWWSGPQITLDEFKQNMNAYLETHAPLEERERWDSIAVI